MCAYLDELGFAAPYQEIVAPDSNLKGTPQEGSPYVLAPRTLGETHVGKTFPDLSAQQNLLHREHRSRPCLG
ncbi:hypothetical protein TRIP_E210060 [uncultured Spirochaetota bacterium]|uniref:Uncharacterized protein n=1 Tax=uncultured Spirochaetota bacterium TaxID=460511 RepID=A0A652ZV82_9SPIR|nr:hypothetical protein TRIP_E210060 [uncultured Spirochaetota bacterium]